MQDIWINRQAYDDGELRLKKENLKARSHLFSMVIDLTGLVGVDLGFREFMVHLGYLHVRLG